MSYTNVPLENGTLWHFDITDSSQSSPEMGSYVSARRSRALENGTFGRKRLFEGQDENGNDQETKRARQDQDNNEENNMDFDMMMMIDEEQMAQEFFEAGYEADCEDNEEYEGPEDFEL